ncbi:hypothetical protein [Natrinema altunense]|uniref:CARDB domain-containing protein n=1 Tax=Natrinema altunense TaxID=222984 RepID=A0A482Y059_9EURY|nr:hypothetical protein [Natrinema altunense]RZH67764.1 hypothetical protein ELS17_10640 [Natrinema altunense]
MNRRTFIGVSGIGFGLAGCLDADSDTPTDSNGSRSDSDLATGNATDGATEEADRNADPSTDTEAETETTGTGDDSGGESGDAEPTVTFPSCTRAEVTGTFAADDVAFASTDFYEDGLYGNTMLEDGIVFGEDVAAPFSGTVAFEIGETAAVRESSDEVVVEIPPYGSDGTVISSLTTEREAYLTGGVTHGNPHARECLREIEADDDGDTDAETPAAFEIVRFETNAPIDAGDFLEVSATIENTGGTDGTQPLELIVGHSSERVERRTVSLAAGERTTVTTGYETPRVDADQEVPVRIEAGDDAAERSVLVHGTD